MTQSNHSDQPDPPALPLSGIRILDLGRLFAVPLATQTLGDLGAEVIKIEHPTRGDDMRTYGPPFLRDSSGGSRRESTYFLAANRNKKSVAVDLATPEGQEVIRKLVMTCDVMVENFKVGSLRKYGLDYESICRIKPDIIYCSLTGYGQDGPFSHKGGNDSVAQAVSGLMSLTGEPDGEPQKTGVAVNDFVAGMYTAIAILGALRHREVNGGPGQHIDLSLVDCGIALLSHRALEYLVAGEIPERTGNRTSGSAPAQIFSCSDRVIMIQAGGDEPYRRLCRVIGRPELVQDKRFATRSDRVVHIDALIPEIEAVLRTRTRAEWVDVLEAAGVMCAPVNTVPEALDSAQIRHRRMVREVSGHALAASVPLIANPIRYSKTPLTRISPPPMLGQHTKEVLDELAQSVASKTEK